MALDVELIRKDFPILSKPLPNGAPLVYLDSAATAQKPRLVIDRITECYERHYANVHRGIYQLADDATAALEESREAVQRFIGAAEAEEIVFTSGATMSLNLVAQGWGRRLLGTGDEIVVTEMEHHSNLVPWQEVAKETGAKLRFLPLTDDGRLDLSQLDRVITGKTKIVAVTGMSNVLGTVNPLQGIIGLAHECGAIVVVDGAQLVPHLRVDVQQAKIDFLAFSGHKVYGPSGIGILYGRRELLERMSPFHCGSNMVSEVHWESSSWASIPAKFEAGTPPIVPAMALGSAIAYVERIGFDEIRAHERQLTEYALYRLARVPGVTIYGPSLASRGGIISFTMDGIHAHDIAALVDMKRVAIRAGHHCAMPLHERLGVPATARVSLGLYNTKADLDVFVESLYFAREKLRLGES